MTETTYERMEDYAHAGADLLDRRDPDWWRYIDAGTLDLKSTSDCVLGQIYGGYSQGTMAVFGEDYSDAPFEHGFDAVDMYEMNILQDIWLDLILERKLQASVFAGNPTCPWPRPEGWVS